MKWLRKWLYNLLFVPAAVRMVTMSEAEWEKEKAKRQFQFELDENTLLEKCKEECVCNRKKGETDVVS